MNKNYFKPLVKGYNAQHKTKNIQDRLREVNVRKIILFFIIVPGLLLYFFSPSIEAYELTATKIKYTLNGEESGEITLDTPVTFTYYADGAEHDAVEIYTFPEQIEGTIESIDIYVTMGDDSSWLGELVNDPGETYQDFAGDGIEVTNDTTSIYIGAKEGGEGSIIIAPSTE